MSDEETRAKRAKKIKMKKERDPVARFMNEHGKVFREKKKPLSEPYKRVKLNPKNFREENEE